jgi:hypothetical protein
LREFYKIIDLKNSSAFNGREFQELQSANRNKTANYKKEFILMLDIPNRKN